MAHRPLPPTLLATRALWVVGPPSALLGLLAAAFAHATLGLGAAVLVGLGGTGVLMRLAWRRVPAALLEERTLVVAFALLGSLAVAQTARHVVYISEPDPQQAPGWAKALPTDGFDHLCLAAYLRGAELASTRPEALYDAREYTASAEVPTSVEGMRRHMADPFHYPPTALLLPAAGLSISSRLPPLRAAWSLLQCIALLLATVATAPWFTGRARWLHYALALGVWASLPSIHTLEYGQAHLATLALAVAGMAAIHRGRPTLGGGLLAVAISWKVFPALLLLDLALRRRWRALGATAAWGAALLAATLLAWGPAPVVDFLARQFPAMLGGAAFSAFFAGDGVTAQLSPQGIAQALGASGAAVAALGWLWTAGLVGLTVATARRPPNPLAWLALLNLAALRTPFAPASYVSAGVVWLLALWVARRYEEGRPLWPAIAAWAVVQTTPFAASIPGVWADLAQRQWAQLPSLLLAAGFCAAACLPRRA